MNRYDEELSRVASFKNWPLNFPSGSVFARAGLFYTGQDDTVRCFKCHCSISNWKETDVPAERHRRVSPGCPLFESYSLPRHLITHPTDDAYRLQNEFSQPALIQQEAPTVTLMNNVSVLVSHPSTSLTSVYPAVDKSQNNGHLKSEFVRLGTFVNWNIPFVKPADLAHAGFFSMSIRDVVKCVFCDGILKEWEPGDVPISEHKKHFPNCPFVSGLDVGNIPLSVQRMNPVLQPEQSTLTSESLKSSYVYQSECANPVRMAMNFDVNFAEDIQRRLSFYNKPLPRGQTSEKFADAGFYYTGPGDSVKCFQCGGVLKQWNPLDDPWMEHARWFPHCAFVHNKKGRSFIENALHGHSRPETQIAVQTGNSGEDRDQTQKKEHLPAESPDELTSVKQPYLPSSEHEETTRARNYPVPVESSSSSAAATATSSVSQTKPSKIKDDEEMPSVEQENERLRDALLCKICMDGTANTVFLPCGHLLCCEKCAPVVAECPVCRGVIKGTLKIYMS